LWIRVINEGFLIKYRLLADKKKIFVQVSRMIIEIQAF